MQYLLMIYLDEKAAAALPDEVRERGTAAYMAYNEALAGAGVFVGGARLRPTADATTVRLSDGKARVLDGPYAEAKEQLGGYYLIDVPDLDAALAWAARCPGAAHGIVEVRPLWPMMAEAVARTSYGKLVAWLAARTHDVAAAEDALSAAFAAALASWPRSGRPANPEAWLVTVARRRLVDQARRRRVSTAAEPALRLLAEGFALGPDASRLPDQRLGLLFACAHPALDPAVHAPLMLQVVLGLDAVRIASAFLTSPAAMAKRLVRAKTKIREAGIPFAVPDRDELAPRLGPVLEAIYAVFTDGWSDPTAADGRGGLTGEAIYLARLVAELLPVEPEAAGLLALLLHAEARRSARRDAAGAYVPLVLQNPADWDEALGAEAEALLHRASAFGRIGRFQLEAALQSAHVDGRRSGRPDWPAILRLYDALLALVPSPVVAMNRAVALAAVEGPAAGLAALDGCGAEGRLESYQPYWAARADLLARCRRDEEARSAYARAIGLEPDPAVRAFLLARQAETAR